MTLSQMIKLRTNNGRDVIDFLVAVMRDRYEDFSICHRLRAARLLTTYGNEDAPGFIADNPRPKTARRNSSKSKHPTKFDTELARVIREDTRDGRSIARFLIDVMEGDLRRFKPHHRMAAACELLDRGFGKSAHKEEDPTVHPEPVEEPDPTEAPEPVPTVVPAEAGTQQGQDRETLTPHSSPLTPKQLTLHQTDILDTLTHISPDHFEHTVLDLLKSMGYGNAKRLGRTGDGGIDGIIDRNEDYFELDTIYVQAKRWTGPVGEPEIRNFSGSLDPHGATRGIFITTSDFTTTARKTAAAISIGTKRIRLMNGHELAHLMHHYNIQVTPDILQPP